MWGLEVHSESSFDIYLYLFIFERIRDSFESSLDLYFYLFFFERIRDSSLLKS